MEEVLHISDWLIKSKRRNRAGVILNVGDNVFLPGTTIKSRILSFDPDGVHVHLSHACYIDDKFYLFRGDTKYEFKYVERVIGSNG